MAVIFLSYRREDSADLTGRLFDHLSVKVGRNLVFRDVDSILVGVDFRVVLKQEVEGCGVLLAVIGPKWLTVVNQSGLIRVEDPDDFVRIEIETALAWGIPVLLVLPGTEPPQADRLPVSLTPLATCPYLRLRPGLAFRDDVEQLVHQIGLLSATSPRKQPVLEKGLSALEVAEHGALQGGLLGIMTGVVLLLLYALQPAWEQRLSLGFVAVYLLAWSVLGWRRLGFLGAVLGPVAGLASLTFALVFLWFSLVMAFIPAGLARLPGEPSEADVLQACLGGVSSCGLVTVLGVRGVRRILSQRLLHGRALVGVGHLLGRVILVYVCVAAVVFVLLLVGGKFDPQVGRMIVGGAIALVLTVMLTALLLATDRLAGALVSSNPSGPLETVNPPAD